MLHPTIFGSRNPCPRGDFLTIIAIQKAEERPNLPAAPKKKVGFSSGPGKIIDILMLDQWIKSILIDWVNQHQPALKIWVPGENLTVLAAKHFYHIDSRSISSIYSEIHQNLRATRCYHQLYIPSLICLAHPLS